MSLMAMSLHFMRLRTASSFLGSNLGDGVNERGVIRGVISCVCMLTEYGVRETEGVKWLG